MAAALPIVATAVGGNTEAVKDGVNGLIVPADDEAKLSEAIAHLISNPAEAKAMGAAGQAIAASRFTTEAMMNQIAEIYARLLAD
jgi:glycosyltransferase involved in cell wall biosynthesis